MGAEKDELRAVQCYERMLSYGMESATANWLGTMYFYGRGVQPAKEELLKYRKALFGKWVRR